MEMTQILLLAVVQGVTEFLPVSSSAHLLVTSDLLGYRSHSLGFDIAVHFATLLAAVLYFAKDIRMLAVKYVFGIKESRAFVNALALGTIPVAVVGFFAYDSFDAFRNTSFIAFALIISGFILFALDYIMRRGTVKTVIPMERRGLMIGLFQVMALLPGVSRSGITIAAGRLAGFSRKEATRFSFLLSAPVIGGAVLLAIINFLSSPAPLDAVMGVSNFVPIAIAMGVSFIVALTTIHLFLKTVERIGFSWFFAYQTLLGVTLLLFV